jgi:hypothetical protein
MPGNGQLHVGQAHHDVAVPAADIAGRDAERHAEHGSEGDGGEAHDERDAAAVDDGREDVAALVVGAEQELGRAALLPDRRGEGVHQAEAGRIERVMRRDPGGERGDDEG